MAFLFVLVVAISPVMSVSASRPVPRGTGAGAWTVALGNAFEGLGPTGISGIGVNSISRLSLLDSSLPTLDRRFEPLMDALAEENAATPAEFDALPADIQAARLKTAGAAAAKKVREEAQGIVNDWRAGRILPHAYPLENKRLETLLFQHREFLDAYTLEQSQTVLGEMRTAEAQFEAQRTDARFDAIWSALMEEAPVRDSEADGLDEATFGRMEWSPEDQTLDEDEHPNRRRGLESSEDKTLDPLYPLSEIQEEYVSKIEKAAEKEDWSGTHNWNSAAFTAIESRIRDHFIASVKQAGRFSRKTRSDLNRVRAQVESLHDEIEELRRETPIPWRVMFHTQDRDRVLSMIDRFTRRMDGRLNRQIARVQSLSDRVDELHEETSWGLVRPLSRLLKEYASMRNAADANEERDPDHRVEVERFLDGGVSHLPSRRAVALAKRLEEQGRLSAGLRTWTAISLLAALFSGFALTYAFWIPAGIGVGVTILALRLRDVYAGLIESAAVLRRN